MLPTQITVFALDGIGEVQTGDDLGTLIGDAVAGDIQDGDILAVTSKIVSKAEGRVVQATFRERAIDDETIRVVATKEHPGGVTRIVENRNGFILAAAGVDASNTPEGTVLLLPVDPDGSAQKLRASLNRRFGARIGIVITDTFGRPWREGQTDVAIGAAGFSVIDDLVGTVDAHGRPLTVTRTAIADEVAGVADLVKGKTSQRPVAIIRGLEHLVTVEDGPGAAAIVRRIEDDLFSKGTAEAYAEGYEAGYRSALTRAQDTSPQSES